MKNTLFYKILISTVFCINFLIQSIFIGLLWIILSVGELTEYVDKKTSPIAKELWTRFTQKNK